MENSSANWIDTPFNDFFDGLFEETLEVDENGVIELIVGAIGYIDAMFINDVEVEFVIPELGGSQQFIFNVEFE